jgi:hypothetical protein
MGILTRFPKNDVSNEGWTASNLLGQLLNEPVYMQMGVKEGKLATCNSGNNLSVRMGLGPNLQLDTPIVTAEFYCNLWKDATGGNSRSFSLELFDGAGLSLGVSPDYVVNETESPTPFIIPITNPTTLATRDMSNWSIAVSGKGTVNGNTRNRRAIIMDYIYLHIVTEDDDSSFFMFF